MALHAMTDFPFDLVGFDLDGTLVDSAPDLAAAVNHALSTIDRAPITVDAVRPMMGGGARLMLERALAATGGPGDLDALFPELLAHYEAHIANLTRPFPHVIAALDELRARGVTLAVVTNKLEYLSLKLLNEINILDRFACVIGGDTLGVGKPDPAPVREMVRRCGGTRPAFVGDTVYDVKGAQSAGVPCALFLPNGGDPSGADATFSDYAALLDTLVHLTDD
jgi:phosphoglycolate phosphatase